MRFKLLRAGVPILAALVFIGTATARAQDPPTTGPSTAPATAPSDAGPSKPSRDKAWVSGTILHPDGKPAAGLQVRAEKNEPRSMGGPAAGTAGPRVYTATTDDDGHFLIKEMDNTAYILVVGSSEVGWIYQELAVEPGKEVKLGRLTLTKID